MSEPVFMGVSVRVGMRESERECARFCLVSLPPHLHMCSSKVTLPLLTPLPWPPSPPRARVCACVRVPFGWPSKLGISSVLGGTTPGALSPMVSRKSLLAPLTTAPSLVRPRAVCICSLWWVAFEAGL